MFSPPKTKKRIPDFFKSLEPVIYEELKMENTAPIQKNSTQYSVKAQKDAISAEIIKHKLSVMHLFFPGVCKFVSASQELIEKSQQRNATFLAFLFHRKMAFLFLMTMVLCWNLMWWIWSLVGASRHMTPFSLTASLCTF